MENSICNRCDSCYHSRRSDVSSVIGPMIAMALTYCLSHWLPESPRYDLLRNRREAAHKTIQKTYPTMSDEYVAIKFAALEEVVGVSAEFQKKYNTLGRLKLVMTKSKYGKPAITALGIGIFQQLCGFNSLSRCSIPPAQSHFTANQAVYYSATMFSLAGFDNPTATGLSALRFLQRGSEVQLIPS